jgi:hypothetical protein
MEHGGKIIPRGVRTGLVLYTSQLQDVELTNLATNDLLVRNGQKWINVPQNYPLSGSYPFSRVIKTPSQTLLNDATARLSFLSSAGESYDPYSMWNSTSNAFIIPFDGIWEFTASVIYPTNANGWRMLLIERNTVDMALVRLPATNTNTTGLNITAAFKCLKDDIVNVDGRQTSGSPLTLPTTDTSYFSAKYIGNA